MMESRHVEIEELMCLAPDPKSTIRNPQSAIRTPQSAIRNPSINLIVDFGEVKRNERQKSGVRSQEPGGMGQNMRHQVIKSLGHCSARSLKSDFILTSDHLPRLPNDSGS